MNEEKYTAGVDNQVIKTIKDENTFISY
ncbi:MAG: hypothetical protein ACTS73_08055 [Arsenophonus sp. NEOnobi-MAG3]